MKLNLLAKASITINAPVSKVWDALITPEAIKHYMFGSDTVSDWKEGSPIIGGVSGRENPMKIRA